MQKILRIKVGQAKKFYKVKNSDAFCFRDKALNELYIRFWALWI